MKCYLNENDNIVAKMYVMDDKDDKKNESLLTYVKYHNQWITEIKYKFFNKLKLGKYSERVSKNM